MSSISPRQEVSCQPNHNLDRITPTTYTRDYLLKLSHHKDVDIIKLSSISLQIYLNLYKDPINEANEADGIESALIIANYRYPQSSWLMPAL